MSLSRPERIASRKFAQCKLDENPRSVSLDCAKGFLSRLRKPPKKSPLIPRATLPSRKNIADFLACAPLVVGVATASLHLNDLAIGVGKGRGLSVRCLL